MSILSFFKKLLYEDVPEKTTSVVNQPNKSLIPPYIAPPMPQYSTHINSDLDEAIIISCYFNPMNSPYRRIAFEKFYEGIKHFNHKIVECVIGDSEAQLPEQFEKVYTKSLLWHKETLLNRIIKDMPKKYKYIFWLDADILFTNPNWLLESVQVMKNGANMVQPFEYAIHLNKDEFAPNFNVNAYRRNCSAPTLRHKQLWRSFCSNHPTLSNNINYDAHGHVGFAWGIRRDVLDLVPGGLYDKALVGGADHIMAHAAAGHIPHNCITKSFTDDIQSVNEWSKMFYAAVKGKLGFVEGDVYHIWHGELKDRAYFKRVTEFTTRAKRIQQRDSNGLYVTTDEEDDNYMLNYFMTREIMGDDFVELDSDPNSYPNDYQENYQDNSIIFGGGQSDGGGSGGTWVDDRDQQIIYGGGQSALFDNNQPQDNFIHQDTNTYNIVDTNSDNNYTDNSSSSDSYQGSTFS